MNAIGWGETYWLIHDTLTSNGVKKTHPFFYETVERFHADVLTHVSASDNLQEREKRKNDQGPKNQWFLVIETKTMQACLSMQPCYNNRTRAFGVLTLQMMSRCQVPPSDLLYRATFSCLRQNLATKAVIETALLNGWHKYEMLPEPPNAGLCGRRHHFRAMLEYLHGTGWIASSSDRGEDIGYILSQEYRLRRSKAHMNAFVVHGDLSPIRPGKFRPDVGLLRNASSP